MGREQEQMRSMNIQHFVHSAFATRDYTRRELGKDHIGLWLSILLLCLLPIQRLMIPFGLTLADIVLVLLTLYTIGQAWRARQKLRFPLILPMWLIFFSSSIATLAGLAHIDSVIAIVQEIYIFVWFLALVNLFQTFPQSELDTLMKVWSIIACIEAFTTMMGMFRIGPTMFYTKPSYDPETSSQFARAIGTFVNSNAAAVYLSVSFFIVLATSWPLRLRSVLATWLFAGIFATGSNGALFSTAGSLALLIGGLSIVKNRQDIKLLCAITGLGIGIMAFALLILDFSSLLLSEFGLGSSKPLLLQTFGRLGHSVTSRLDITVWAWETYRRHLWGTGPNSFASMGGSLHNDYTAFWFERGPLGIIGWLWLVGAILSQALQAARQLADKHERWQILVLGAGFLACAVNALSHEVSHMRQVWILIIFLFTLSYVFVDRQNRTPGHCQFSE